MCEAIFFESSYIFDQLGQTIIKIRLERRSLTHGKAFIFRLMVGRSDTKSGLRGRLDQEARS